jgi:hypothetical protein
MRELFFFSLFFLLAACHGGNQMAAVQDAPKGWVSSGGEIFDDSQNPWFLDDGKPIRYCVELDSATFSSPPDEVRRQIHAAISYWQNEFDAYAKSGGELIKPPLARFEETSCTDETELRFKLGSGSLSAESIAYLSRLAPHVSLAVRTEYDRTMLRGKGFIYIASDQGQTRYPQGEAFVDRPWQHPGLLWRILVHEMGHVLGIPHFGYGIMSAHYPERILKAEAYKGHLSVKHLGSVLRIPEKYLNCTLQLAEAARKWFQIPEGYECLVVQIPKPEAERSEVNFFAANLEGGKPHFLGQAASEKSSLNFHLGLDGFATLFLPPEQKLIEFKNPQEKFKALFFLLTMDVGLRYTPASGGEPQELYLKLQPDAYQLMVRQDGVIHSLLSHRENCFSFPFGHVCSGL